MYPQYEARPDVEHLPPGYAGEVSTGCQAIRLTNLSATDALTLDVGGQPFALAPGQSWGLDAGDVRAALLRPLRVRLAPTGTARVERLYLSLIA